MNTLDLIFAFPQAIITGLAVGVLCSLLSVIVVLKRMAFIGQGISHAGFGGVGLAVFLGVAPGSWQQALIVFAFCLGTGLLIGALARPRRIQMDAAIGILLAATMAGGALLIALAVSLQSHAWYTQAFGRLSRAPSYESLFFGSITSVNTTHMVLALTLGGGVLLTGWLFFKEILFYAFDEQVSQVFGVRTRLIHYLLLTLLSITIVLSIKLAGFVLVSALLVIPGSTALMLSRRLGWVFGLSVLTGVAGTGAGLMLSLIVGTLPTGPCIVAALCAIFAAGLVIQRVRAMG